MIKNIFFIIAILSVKLTVGATIELPETFYIDQQTVILGNNIYTIRSNERDLGFIRRHFSQGPGSKVAPQFDLYHLKQGLEATARVGLTDLPNRVVFNLADGDGLPLGRIEEDWTNTSYYPVFELYSPSNELIAKGRYSLLQHTFTITDSTENHVLATSSSGFFTWTHTVQLKDSNQLDSRLFLLLSTIPMEYRKHSPGMSQKNYSIKDTGPSHSALIQELQAYGQRYSDLHPSDDDVGFIMKHINPFDPEIMNEGTILSEKERVQIGIHQMLPLLDDETLTPEQRAALHLILTQELHCHENCLAD